jgi:hypothetical protein
LAYPHSTPSVRRPPVTLHQTLCESKPGEDAAAGQVGDPMVRAEELLFRSIQASVVQSCSLPAAQHWP